ncbi:MAG: hypothetical protein AB8H80_17580 [Planctomycetota bacterium]
MNKQTLLNLAAATCLAPLAMAQIGSTTYSVDLDTSTGNNGHLGCVHVNGEIFVSARWAAGTAVPPHTVYVYDQAGTLTRQFDQPASTSTSVWGYRDGASDGLSLIFGYEGGIEILDVNGAPALGLITLNGFATPVQPIVSSAGIGTHRAIAYDMAGNGGDGSIFVGDFGADIQEIALDGTVINTYLNNDGWSAYGLALDKDSGTMWMNSAPASGQIKEYTIDRANSAMIPTGRVIDRVAPASTQGGLDWVDGGLDGRNCGSDLLGVDQSGPDFVNGYRVELWDGYDQTMEPELVISVDNGPVSTGTLEVFGSASTLEIDVTGTPGLPYLLFADVAGEPARPRGAVAGFRSAWELTYPRPNSVFVGGFTTGAPSQIAASVLTSAPAGQQIQWQGIAIDPNLAALPCGIQLPLVATNTAIHENAPPFAVQVRASGTNSFNADATSGFFQVTGGALVASDPIVSVEFDWVASSNALQIDMEFDCDQTAMADTFLQGNGGGCAGTYRNGSDVAAGLDYANTANNLSDAVICAASLPHVEATNQVGPTPDYRTLKWYFTGAQFVDGVTFEFDIDTDLGAGVGGDDMAGMVVTIELLSGTILTGELVADPTVGNTAVIRL